MLKLYIPLYKCTTLPHHRLDQQRKDITWPTFLSRAPTPFPEQLHLLFSQALIPPWCAVALKWTYFSGARSGRFSFGTCSCICLFKARRISLCISRWTLTSPLQTLQSLLIIFPGRPNSHTKFVYSSHILPVLDQFDVKWHQQEVKDRTLRHHCWKSVRLLRRCTNLLLILIPPKVWPLVESEQWYRGRRSLSLDLRQFAQPLHFDLIPTNLEPIVRGFQLLPSVFQRWSYLEWISAQLRW